MKHVLFTVFALTLVLTVQARAATSRSPIEVGDAEIHAISVYEGNEHKNGRVRVKVAISDRPLVLVLSAYESVEWTIEPVPNVIIQAVILQGYHRQTLNGLKPTTAVWNFSHEDGTSEYPRHYFGYKKHVAAHAVSSYFGKAPVSTQGRYRGDFFVVGQYGTFEFHQMEQAYREQYRTKRERPTPKRSRPVTHRPSFVYPITSGSGIINSQTIRKYNTLAVYQLLETPNAKGSGDIAAAMLAGQLSSKGFSLVERTRLKSLFKEQRTQLAYSDEEIHQLKVGRLAGASGIVVGEISQWETQQARTSDGAPFFETYVALAIRVLDAETGEVLFSGDGHFSRPSPLSKQGAARVILRALVTRLALKSGLVSTGHAGFRWDMQNGTNGPRFRVTEFDPTSPARMAGLRSGDLILSCNGSSSRTWKTLWDSMRACQAEASQPLDLEIARGTHRLPIFITTGNRFIESHEPAQKPLQ